MHSVCGNFGCYTIRVQLDCYIIGVLKALIAEENFVKQTIVAPRVRPENAFTYALVCLRPDFIEFGHAGYQAHTC